MDSSYYNRLPKTINPKFLHLPLFRHPNYNQVSISPSNIVNQHRQYLPSSSSASLEFNFFRDPVAYTPTSSIGYSNSARINNNYNFRREHNLVLLSEDWRLLPSNPSSSTHLNLNPQFDFDINEINFLLQTQNQNHSIPLFNSSVATHPIPFPLPFEYSPHHTTPSLTNLNISYTMQEGMNSSSSSRSRIFPFTRINLENQFRQHLQYNISSERGQVGIETDEPNLGQTIPALVSIPSNENVNMISSQNQHSLDSPINLNPSSSSSSSSSTQRFGNPFLRFPPVFNSSNPDSDLHSNLNPLQPGLNSFIEDETEDESDSYLAEDNENQENKNSQDQVENVLVPNEEILNIELSSSSSSSSGESENTTKSKTTVISLGETSPNSSSVDDEYRPAALKNHIPKSSKRYTSPSPSSSPTPSSSASEESYTKDCESPITRNGRYPTRLNTIKSELKEKNQKRKGGNKLKSTINGKGNSKEVVKGKAFEKEVEKVKSKGKGKIIENIRSNTAGSSSSYKSSNNGIVGRGMINGEKVPTGPFLFQLMKMLAYDKYPGYVILKNQIAYIPDTEAFAANVYAEKDGGKAGSVQWTSFQRNLNNYSKYWPFKRRAVENTRLSAQTIEIPTIEELGQKWLEYGFALKSFQREKMELEEWVKNTYPIKSIKLMIDNQNIPESIFSRSNSKCKSNYSTGFTQNQKQKLNPQDEDEEEFLSEEEFEIPLSQNQKQKQKQKGKQREEQDDGENQEENNEEKLYKDKISTPEKNHLRLKINGNQFTPTPEKPTTSNKRKFADLSSDSSIENEDEIQESQFTKTLYTPSPTFSIPLLTLITAGYSKTTPTTYVEGNTQLPTPVTATRPQHWMLDLAERSEQVISHDSSSGGREGENDVFGPVISISN